jgi:two-component sensor histidine kinase
VGQVADQEPRRTVPPVSLEMAGGAEAPRNARAAVLSALREYLSPADARDVALVVSELVTNSVEHAATGPKERLAVEVGVAGDCVHIEVSDGGTRFHRRNAPRHPDAPQALGLALVDRLARSWGVARDGEGHTRVWCELPLGAGRATPAS